MKYNIFAFRYGVGEENHGELRGALKSLLPRYVRDKPIWLSSDTAMVPPAVLVDRGVSLCRTVQEPGQFVLVFPNAFTSSVCTGYVVSESVYFAQPSWLDSAEHVFRVSYYVQFIINVFMLLMNRFQGV